MLPDAKFIIKSVMHEMFEDFYAVVSSKCPQRLSEVLRRCYLPKHSIKEEKGLNAEKSKILNELRVSWKLL